MPSVTIIGAGVFGLSIANSLPRSYDVTIVARDMPGDPDSLRWASPWAGAGFGGGGTKPGDPLEMEMLKASFQYYWNLSESHPESSVKRMPSIVYRDNTDTDSDLWWRNFMPNYRILSPSELPPKSDAKIGMTYTGLVITPAAYLDFLHARLLAAGVIFVRRTVGSLLELRGASDVIVNATGVGARTLGGVEDPDVEPVRGQTVLVRLPSVRSMSLRTGNDYCYVIPRGDGTVVLGGIKGHGQTDGTIDPAQRADVVHRAHEIEPLIPDSIKDLEIIRDIVGIRPGRKTGMRVEAEVVDGINIVHAYGAAGVGYAMSAGVGRKVAQLIDDFVLGDKAPVPTRAQPKDPSLVSHLRVQQDGKSGCVSM